MYLKQRVKYWLTTDEAYIRNRYRDTFNEELNLDFPSAFSEKIQWLKLFHRKGDYSFLADKYEVRKYVQGRSSSKYLNNLIAVYSRVEDICVDTLPSSFVLKANHGSGWNIVVKNKDEVDWRASMRKLRSWLGQNYYYFGREWVYKNIEPKILCESLLLGVDGGIPYDYKVFTFNGNPLVIQVDVDRFGKHTRAFYDTEWKRLPFTIMYPQYAFELEKPQPLAEMLEVASLLGRNIPFCRVDLYAIGKSIKFGELTFYPGNGMEKFIPAEFDLTIGNMLQLPDRDSL